MARIRAPRPDLEIAIVGKYTELPDAYISVTEALKHAALHHRVDVKVRWIRSEQLERMEPEQVANELKGVAACWCPAASATAGWRARCAPSAGRASRRCRSWACAWACNAR